MLTILLLKYIQLKPEVYHLACKGFFYIWPQIWLEIRAFGFLYKSFQFSQIMYFSRDRISFPPPYFFSPEMVIMANRFHLSFIRLQNISPKIKAFVPMCILKLWSHFLCFFWGKGFLLTERSFSLCRYTIPFTLNGDAYSQFSQYLHQVSNVSKAMTSSSGLSLMV